jgi:predicted small secreted protein
MLIDFAWAALLLILMPVCLRKFFLLISCNETPGAGRDDAQMTDTAI